MGITSGGFSNSTQVVAPSTSSGQTTADNGVNTKAPSTGAPQVWTHPDGHIDPNSGRGFYGYGDICTISGSGPLSLCGRVSPLSSSIIFTDPITGLLVLMTTPRETATNPGNWPRSPS